MYLVRTMSLFVAMGVAVSAQTPPPKHPDFSGRWQLDLDASKALTEKKGEVWTVAGATSSAGAPAPAQKAMLPAITITQSDAEIVLENRYEGESAPTSHIALKLDGSVSVNATRTSSSRSTSVWKGASLVTTGTTHFDFSDGSAFSANGDPIREFTREYVTTRTLLPDGTMQLEDRSTQNGHLRVAWNVYARVK